MALKPGDKLPNGMTLGLVNGVYVAFRPGSTTRILTSADLQSLGIPVPVNYDRTVATRSISGNPPSSGGSGGQFGAPTPPPSGGGALAEFGYDPFAGGGTQDPFGAAGSQADFGQGSSSQFWNSDFGKFLINLGLGFASDKLLGGRTSEEKALAEMSRAGFSSEQIQRFLPFFLRKQFTDPILGRGIAGIGDLISRPGGLSPSVSEAILPRLAAESESIATNFRGLQQNQAGAAARYNLPVSIKGALQSALDVAQERAQRGARREALTESEQLRRGDLGQTFNLLDALLQFTSSGRGQAVAGLGQAANLAGQRQASRQALFGNLFPTS